MNDWDLPMFFHVLGAMVMVGGLLLATTSLLAAWRADDAAALRLGFRALLWVTLPAWLVMRVFAQITLDESPYDDEQAWIGIGYGTSEVPFPLLIIATVLAGISARRGVGGTRLRVAVVLIGIVLAAWLIAIWAMTTKPD